MLCRRLPEVLDVILDCRQIQSVAYCAHEGYRLLRGTPVHIWKQPGENQVESIITALLSARTWACSSLGFLTVT